MNRQLLLSLISALAITPIPAAVLAQIPAKPSTQTDEPLCYAVIGQRGSMTNLSSLCGQQRGNRPVNTASAKSSPVITRTELAPSPVGTAPVPRLNLRSNRDTQIQDYR